MRRLLTLLLTTLLLGGCTNNLGRTIPVCDGGVTTSVILQVQAVREAAFVPCIESLPVGWEYNHLQAQSGVTEFTLDSDRMGDEFVRVRTSTTCDIGGTREMESPIPGTLLFSDVTVDLVVPIVIVPEGPTDATVDAAQAIALELVGNQIRGKAIDLVIDSAEEPASERIAEARARGAHVFVIGLREAEEGTVTLLVADRIEEETVEVEHAIDELADIVGPPTIRGSWFHLFDGGCIEYRFDASGPETHDLERHVRASLGFTDADQIRDLGRSLGFDL